MMQDDGCSRWRRWERLSTVQDDLGRLVGSIQFAFMATIPWWRSFYHWRRTFVQYHLYISGWRWIWIKAWRHITGLMAEWWAGLDAWMNLCLIKLGRSPSWTCSDWAHLPLVLFGESLKRFAYQMYLLAPWKNVQTPSLPELALKNAIAIRTAEKDPFAPTTDDFLKTQQWWSDNSQKPFTCLHLIKTEHKNYRANIKTLTHALLRSEKPPWSYHRRPKNHAKRYRR